MRVAGIMLLLFALTLGGWAFYDYEQHNGPASDALNFAEGMKQTLDVPELQKLQTPETIKIQADLHREFLTNEAAKNADENRGILAVLALIVSVNMIASGKKIEV